MTGSTKKFHLREVLAMICGLWAKGQDGQFADLQGIYDFIPVQKGPEASVPSLFDMRKREWVLNQHPNLRNYVKLTPEENRIVQAGIDRAEIDRILNQWLANNIAKFGENIVLTA